MRTLVITKSDLDSDNKYIGGENLGTYSEPAELNVEIAEGLGYVSFEKSVVVRGYIYSKAGSGIKAGYGIKAGWGIKAGEGIEAGEGIVSGLSISCKLSLSVALRIFAGVCWWREISDGEKEVTCGKLEKGEVAYGTLEEIGLPDKKPTGRRVKVKLDNGEIVGGELMEGKSSDSFFSDLLKDK